MTSIQPQLRVEPATAAVASGASETSRPADEHGWRIGRIVDPFGHGWEIGCPLGTWPPAG